MSVHIILSLAVIIQGVTIILLTRSVSRLEKRSFDARVEVVPSRFDIPAKPKKIP